MLCQRRPIRWNENMPVHASPLDCSGDCFRYPNCACNFLSKFLSSSAFPLQADIGAVLLTSAKCQFQTRTGAADSASLLDHLVGAGEERRWHVEAAVSKKQGSG